MLTNKIDLSQLSNSLKINLKNDSHYAAWRLASIGIMGFLGLSVIFTIYFIYNNIYNTLSNSNAILVLSSSPLSDTIDIGAYEQAKKIVSGKSQTILIPNKLRDIFSYGTEPAANSSSTKK